MTSKRPHSVSVDLDPASVRVVGDDPIKTDVPYNSDKMFSAIEERLDSEPARETVHGTPIHAAPKAHTQAQREQAVRERMRARLVHFHSKAAKRGGYAADLANNILTNTASATEQDCDSLFRTLVTDDGFSAKAAESIYDAAYSVVMGHR